MITILTSTLCGVVLLYYLSKLAWRLLILWRARDPISKYSRLPIPPGDFGLPVIGETLLWAVQGSRFNSTRREKYGKAFSTNFIGKTMVKVTGPEYVKQILTADYDTVTTIWPTTIQRVLGESSIANSVGIIHKQRRKTFLKAFTHAALNSYIQQMHKLAKKRMKMWAETQTTPLVYPETKEMTFDIAFQVLLGMNFKNEDERLKLFKTFDTMITNLFSLPYDFPGSGFRKALEARKVIHSLLDSHLKEKRKKVREMIDEGEAAADSSDDAVKNALHFILEYEMTQHSRKLKRADEDIGEHVIEEEDEDRMLSDIELKETTVEMLFAGYQTTSSVLTSAVINFIRSPHVFHKIEDELREFGLLSDNVDDLVGQVGTTNNETPVTAPPATENISVIIDNTIPVPRVAYLEGNSGSSEDTLNNNSGLNNNPLKFDGSQGDDDRNGPELTLELLSKMSYLEQVMKETLRIMPPILGGYRMALKTFQLGKYRIPKGWTIIYNIRDTHEAEWSEDMEFNPDRFSPENWKESRESRFRWIPFGGGSRICVGKEFARLQFKIFVIELVRTFRKLEFAKGKPPPMFAIPFLHPTDGLPVKLTRRKSSTTNDINCDAKSKKLK
uniref:cytochrome P450 26B1-like n=1 Tax=Styela clava TaxID=7725 RepID=UPI00193A4370|nr:cytochrome P450 26B1-like [Styela clava]